MCSPDDQPSGHHCLRREHHRGLGILSGRTGEGNTAIAAEDGAYDYPDGPAFLWMWMSLTDVGVFRLGVRFKDIKYCRGSTAPSS